MSDNKQDSIKDKFQQFLLNLTGVDPEGMRELYNLYRDGGSAKETVSEYIEGLYKIINAHPEDAKRMSLDEFLEAHPEVFGDTGNGEATAQRFYHMLVQGRTANKLQKKLTQKITDPAQLDLYGHGSIVEPDFKLFIRGYQEIATVKQTAAMLLDSLMIQATKEGLQNTLIHLPLRDYMAMRGLKDEKETRTQVKQDINALERVSFEFKGTGKQRGAWLKISIAGGTVGQIKNGDIVFRFNQDWFDSFKESGKLMFMQFPREALQANVRQHPYTYWLARKLAEHKRMNVGKSNENIIGVDTLIAACPNFPTYEDVMAGNRNLSQRIIEPFERDMDELKQSLSWHYTDTEPPADYQSFMAATITVKWNEYPDTQELKAAKAKRARRIASKDNPEPKRAPKKDGSKNDKLGG